MLGAALKDLRFKNCFGFGFGAAFVGWFGSGWGWVVLGWFGLVGVGWLD